MGAPVNHVAVATGGIGFLLWIAAIVLFVVGLILVLADGSLKMIMVMLFGGLASWCISTRVP